MLSKKNTPIKIKLSSKGKKVQCELCKSKVVGKDDL